MSGISKRFRGLLGALLATGTIAGFAAVAAAPSAHAAFPGANGPIVYTDEGFFLSPTFEDVKVLDPNTGVVTDICPRAICGTGGDRPETSSDGQTIVYFNSTGVFTMPITGGGITQITTDGGRLPSFTPDGATVVYIVSNTLKRVAATGGSSTSISGAPPTCVGFPEVSPNGATVAYINTCAAGFNLETIPIGGGLPNVVVANIGSHNDQVSWSPDGTKIALQDTNHCPAATPIGVVAATANNAAPTCLPNSASNDQDPSWSPDGTKIALEEGSTDNPAILGANGIGRTVLSNVTDFGNEYWAPQATAATTTTTAPGPTTTTTTPCVGTLTGSAFKGANPKPKKALAGVVLTANPTPPGSASSATTNAAGSYSLSVPCGTYTKTSTGPDTKTRVCHFGSKSGPTTATATVTNGSVDIENLFCKKK